MITSVNGLAMYRKVNTKRGKNFNPGSALRVKFLPENNWVQPRPQGLLAFQYAAILESEKTLGTRLQLGNETREE